MSNVNKFKIICKKCGSMDVCTEAIVFSDIIDEWEARPIFVCWDCNEQEDIEFLPLQAASPAPPRIKRNLIGNPEIGYNEFLLKYKQDVEK